MPTDPHYYEMPINQLSGVVEREVASVAPGGVWVRTHIFRDGDWLKAVVYTTVGGQAEILNFSVYLPPIIKAVKAAHVAMHLKQNGNTKVGWFPASIVKSVAKAATNIAKGKLVKSIGSGLKAVVRSKITGAITGVVAVAFPAVGLPAAAALIAANKTFDVIDSAKKVKASLAALAPMAGAAVAALDHPDGPLATAVKSLPAKVAMKFPIAVPQNAGPAITAALQAHPEWRQALALSAKAKVNVRQLTTAARGGNAQAKAGVKILAIAHRARVTPKGSPAPDKPGTFRAVLIDKRGTIIPGKYLDVATKSVPGTALMLRGRKIFKGKFDKVGAMLPDYTGVGVDRIAGACTEEACAAKLRALIGDAMTNRPREILGEEESCAAKLRALVGDDSPSQEEMNFMAGEDAAFFDLDKVGPNPETPAAMEDLTSIAAYAANPTNRLGCDR